MWSAQPTKSAARSSWRPEAQATELTWAGWSEKTSDPKSATGGEKPSRRKKPHARAPIRAAIIMDAACQEAGPPPKSL
jgi:hypothetical protein